MNENKRTLDYLDLSINQNAQEKSYGFVEYLEALEGNPGSPARVLEIGPGGGAAINGLTDFLQHREVGAPELVVLERFLSQSVELATAQKRYTALGASVVNVAGDIVKMPFQDETFDFINVSAVLHEVYSYVGGYAGIEHAIQEVARITKPGGFFSYRDIHASTDDLHRPTEQCYQSPAWILFVRLFLPYYLENAQHPYSQEQIDINLGTEIVYGSVPHGLARDIQRHYITFRDYIWRSGVLGIKPLPYSYENTGWIDDIADEKKVYFEVIERNEGEGKAIQSELVLDEDEHGLYALGSNFDKITDQRITKLLSSRDPHAVISEHIEAWLKREGGEVYIYDTPESIVQRIEIASRIDCSHFVAERDLSRKISRRYYTGYLKATLGQYALEDAKLLLVFKKEKEKEDNYASITT